MFIVIITDKNGVDTYEKFNNLDCALAYVEARKGDFSSFKVQPLSAKVSWTYKSAAN